VELPARGERYSWDKCNTKVNNIIVGKLGITHYGLLRVREHGTEPSMQPPWEPSDLN
jgi:hypothetical protein